MTKEQLVSPNAITTEFRSRLRDLLYYVAFPISAATSSLLRVSFFDGTPGRPQFGLIIQPQSFSLLDSLYFLVVSILILSPILALGLSHWLFLQSMDPTLKSGDYSLMLKWIHQDLAVLFLGLGLTLLLLVALKVPYLFIFFLCTFTTFYMGKVFLYRKFIQRRILT